jgi:hypothetical protein
LPVGAAANKTEAELVPEQVRVIGAETLAQAVDWLQEPRVLRLHFRA